MLVGSVSHYMAQQFVGILPPILPWNSSSMDSIDESDDGGNDDNDAEPVSGTRTETQIWLAARHHKF